MAVDMRVLLGGHRPIWVGESLWFPPSISICGVGQPSGLPVGIVFVAAGNLKIRYGEANTMRRQVITR